MTVRNKIIAGWIAFLFVIFHCTSIFIYASPSNRLVPALKSFVTPYVEPLFEQQWSMFAPCPVMDGGISMKFYTKDDSTDWIRPAKDAIFWHRWTRITHDGEIALLESNLIHWVNADVIDLNLSLNDPMPDDKIKFFKEGYSYVLLMRYAYGTAKNIGIDRPLSCQMKCDLENVETGEKGMIDIPEFKWTQYE